MEWLNPDRLKKIALLLLVAMAISAVLLWIFEDRFESTAWKSEPTLRYKMVDDLVESQLLMKKTKAETLTLLGQPDAALVLDKDVFLYELGSPPSFVQSKAEQLLIAFEDGKVVKVTFTHAED